MTGQFLVAFHRAASCDLYCLWIKPKTIMEAAVSCKLILYTDGSALVVYQAQASWCL